MPHSLFKVLQRACGGETTSEDADRLGVDFQSGRLTLHLKLVPLDDRLASFGEVLTRSHVLTDCFETVFGSSTSLLRYLRQRRICRKPSTMASCRACPS